jgi:hypothetical protein
MYCSTCGARNPAGRPACDTCGEALGMAAGLPSPLGAGGLAMEGGWARARAMKACPRCAYHGEGISYFSRGSHMAALVGATIVTAGAMGAGGLVYYLMRRDHQVCPRCGRGWGAFAERAPAAGSRHPARTEAPVPGAAAESFRRTWSTLLLVLAAILIVAGAATLTVEAVVLGLGAAGGGLFLRRAADRKREARREALLASLQLPVLQLAARRRGRLTVTEVAASLGWTLARAEKVLQSMDDGLRVDSEVTDEGVIVYEFREIGPGSDRTLPPPGG